MAVRLADLLAGLSRLADLGFGFTAGETLRSCALATGLARSLDLPDDEIRAVLYTSLLQHIGCTGYAHEIAHRHGDEFVLNTAASRVFFELGTLPPNAIRDPATRAAISARYDSIPVTS